MVDISVESLRGVGGGLDVKEGRANGFVVCLASVILGKRVF